jgi:hypothetical protein
VSLEKLVNLEPKAPLAPLAPLAQRVTPDPQALLVPRVLVELTVPLAPPEPQVPPVPPVPPVLLV